jgi:hypothetical protein
MEVRGKMTIEHKTDLILVEHTMEQFERVRNRLESRNGEYLISRLNVGKIDRIVQEL